MFSIQNLAFNGISNGKERVFVKEMATFADKSTRYLSGIMVHS